MLPPGGPLPRSAKQETNGYISRAAQWYPRTMHPIGRLILACLLLTGVTAALPDSAAAQSIEVQDAWIRLGSGQQPAATAYFLVINHGDADRLLEVSSTASEKVILNHLVWHGLNSRLEPVNSLDIPEVSKLQLKPGGYAAVLVDLAEPLRIGQTVPLSLRFEHAGTMDVGAKVLNQLLGNR